MKKKRRLKNRCLAYKRLCKKAKMLRIYICAGLRNPRPHLIRQRYWRGRIITRKMMTLAEDPTVQSRVGEVLHVKIPGAEQSISQEEAGTPDTEDGEVGMLDEAIAIINLRQQLRASTLSIHHKEKRNITLKSNRQRKRLHPRQKFCLTEV